MTNLNDPAVLAEVAAHHDAYERALTANDVAALTGFFWDSPQVVRYGVHEHLYGAAAIADYRQGHTPVFTDRRLLHRSIVAFGPDTASVMCEIQQRVADRPVHARQSQLWIRFPALGWKITAAHVSVVPPAAAPPAGRAPLELWAAYADHAASALQLPLNRAHRDDIALQLQRCAAIAAPMLAFEPPASTERAAIFTP